MRYSLGGLLLTLLMPGDVFTQSTVDFDGAEKNTPLRATPIALLGHLLNVDFIVRQRAQRLNSAA
jgi:hypothetical protein